MTGSSMQVLVTGANGFIGSRLVERLSAMGAHVRALVRRGVLSRPEQQYERIRGDVTVLDTLSSAVQGCELIFHCAWGGNSLAEARRINVLGTRNVLAAAAAAGVRRIVHLSSMAVHGRRLPALLTEEHPLQLQGDAYTVSKAEGERVAVELGAASGIQVVVLRPTLVYGPRSPLWLLSYFERVKQEQLALIDGGEGLANLVYIDDLIDAMCAAAQRPGIAGQAFLISGAQPVPWRQYIGYLAQMCRKPLPPSIPRWRAWLELQATRVYGVLTQRPKRLLGMDLANMTQHTTVSIAKAQRLLAYAPRISLDEGMQRSEAWLRHAGYLPRPAMSS